MIPRKGPAEALEALRTGAGQSLLLVGDTAMDLVASILLLVVVGRFYGPDGLGVYSFLLSVFVIVSFLADLGIEKWIEKEIASGDLQDRNRLLGEARTAILLSGLIGCLFTLAIAVQAADSSTVAGRASSGLWLIALAVPSRLYSGLQISVLQGYGRHPDAVWVSLMGRIVLLCSVFILSLLGLRPELLTAGFVLSESASIIFARRRFRMPSLAGSLRRMGCILDILRKSVRYYFTHEGLKVLFFVDFFILGFFATSSQEGVYAEASVLARLFLIVPLGAAPLYRLRVYRESGARFKQIFVSSRLTAARMFAIHSVMGLLFLFYFPTVSRIIFRARGDTPLFFEVFTLLLPGLLLFASTVVLEPLFMTGGLERDLNSIALSVFILNAILNSYLIPYSGVFGAAVATTVSLVVYFILFMNKISRKGSIPVGAYLVSGGLVYLSYHFLKAVPLTPLLVLPVTVVVLPVLFGVLGLFDQGAEEYAGVSGQETGAR